MPFTEGFQVYIDTHDRLSRAALEKRPSGVVTLSQLITPESGLAPWCQDDVTDLIRDIDLLPKGENLPFHQTWQSHINSEGRYFLEYDTERKNPYKDIPDIYHVYNYVLPPDAQTSTHGHAAIEIYILHAGEFTLFLNGEEAPLERYAIIGPGVEHTGKTGKHPAHITAITYNPLRVPKDTLHEYSWQDKDWGKAESGQFNAFLDSLEQSVSLDRGNKNSYT